MLQTVGMVKTGLFREQMRLFGFGCVEGMRDVDIAGFH